MCVLYPHVQLYTSVLTLEELEKLSLMQLEAEKMVELVERKEEVTERAFALLSLKPVITR